MIFAEVASRVGLLGKVNLPRELSERARSTWSEKGKRKERERAEGEKVRQRNDALAMTKRKSERVMVRGGGKGDSTTSTGRKSPTKLRRCISPFA